MPYTPPAQRSPVASRADTPPRHLGPSSQPATESQQDASLRHEIRPSLPGSNSSQSYLHKHRRKPSLPKQAAVPAEQAAPECKSLKLRISDNITTDKSPPAQARCAPQQPNDKVNGAHTPPSSQSSGDEAPNVRGRNRKVSNLEELHAAIRGIEQNRQGSPSPPKEMKKNEMARDFSKPYLEAAAHINGEEGGLSPRIPLSGSARKISHSRSSTDAAAYFGFPKPSLDSPHRSGSEEDLDDDDLELKPSLIRKKSGELVRPALKGRRRPSSMPGTPTYSKGVHFQDHSLEHVRTFLQVDRPIAVSAGGSPTDPCDEEDEFPFSDEDRPRPAAFDWEIRLTNFPRDTVTRQSLPVRVERIYLSRDTQTLCGKVAVRNLAFHKLVVVRFTLDYWKTTSEVVAEYDRDARRKKANDECDRFTFEIKLEAHTNLENKTMLFCVRYQVGGQEYWDNNHSMNYQVDFAKIFKAQGGKQDVQASIRPHNSPPCSKPSQPRPRSMPSIDDFGSHAAPFNFSSFPQPNAMVGESPIRFRNRPSSKDIVPDAPATKPKHPPNPQAFGNRYDFGASLSAAIQATVPKVSSPRHELPAFEAPQPPTGGQGEINAGGPSAASKPKALTSDKPSLQSPSYHELLDKYCFFGSSSKASAPQQHLGPSTGELKAQPTRTAGTDGASSPPIKASSISDKATSSASPSPPGSPILNVEKKPSYALARLGSQGTSRSASPAMGSAMSSHSHSPGFGYPYHDKGMQNNFFGSHTPTAIQS